MNTSRAEMKMIIVLPKTMLAHLLKQLEKQVCTLSWQACGLVVRFLHEDLWRSFIVNDNKQVCAQINFLYVHVQKKAGITYCLITF